MPSPLRTIPIFVTVATQTQSQDISAAFIMGTVTHDTVRPPTSIAKSGQQPPTSSSWFLSSSSPSERPVTLLSSSSSSVTSLSSMSSQPSSLSSTSSQPPLPPGVPPS